MTDKQLAVLLYQIASRLREATYPAQDALKASDVAELGAFYHKVCNIRVNLMEQAWILERGQ